MVGRSREGAWIEISSTFTSSSVGMSRSREGAWIEIMGGVEDMSKNQSLP